MSIGRTSVEHPVAVLFFVAAILLAGVFSYISIEMESFPEFQMAQVQIITSYPGAAPAELESLVTVPIETRLKTVKDIKEVFSTSRENQSVIMVSFDETVDIDDAVAEVKRAIQEVTAMLPDEATDPFVSAVAMAELPVISLSVLGEQSPNELKDIAETQIKPAFEKLSGVGVVTVIGGTKPCFEVVVDQQKLRHYGLALSDVSRGIQSSNLNMPGGRIDYGEARFLVRTVGAFKDAKDIGSVPVTIQRQPPVLVSDVAVVTETFYPFEGIARVNGKPNVAIQIKKSYGENIVRVAQSCRKELTELSSTLPEGITIEVTADLSEFVEDQMDQVKMSALTGGFLAIFILYLFLRKILMTGIIALSIPLSVLVTVCAMFAWGYSLNYLTLAGIILALGMLVDDSIVVLENIVRHFEMGKSPVVAAIEGAIEIASPVLVSTITTVIVFAPVFLMSDWGPAIMLKHMAFSLVVAVSASYIIAMVVVPSSASVVLALGQGRALDEGKGRSTKEAVTSRWYGRLYFFCLKGILRHPILSCLAIVLTFILSFVMVYQNGFTGKMAISSKQVVLYLNFEPGIGKNYKEEVFEYFENLILKNSEVLNVHSWTNEVTGRGQIMGNLGIRGTAKGLERIKSSLRPCLSDKAGVKVSFQDIASLGTQFPVSVNVSGRHIDDITTAVTMIEKRLQSIDKLINVETSLQSEKREVLVKIDRRRAALRQVSEREIASTVRTALFGMVATRVVRRNRETDVIVKLSKKQAGTFETFGDVLVSSLNGAYVPLREVADITWDYAVPEIIKRDSKQEVRVTGDVEDFSHLVEVSKAVKKAVSELKLPETVTVTYKGQAKKDSQTRSKFLLAFLFAVFLVYGVMTIQFGSFLHAFIIICSLPLALIGSNMSLYFAGVPFDAMAAIGIILLAGIVVNDSIVLVDCVNQMRDSGAPLVFAVAKAGLVRLRPILITSLTTIFGVLPMAFGVGHGAEVYVSLGVTLVGGLTFSTILTLGIIPLTYVIAEKMSGFILKYVFWSLRFVGLSS